MKNLDRAVVQLALMEELAKHGSWCGETHIQKATFFLQELAKVPLGFTFIMYKYGPFSFDLRQELTAMRADQLARIEMKSNQCPALLPSDLYPRLRQLYPKELNKYSRQVSFIASRIGDRNVTELEKLGTALFVKINSSSSANLKELIPRFCELKPHLSPADARQAFVEVDKISDDAKRLGES